ESHRGILRQAERFRAEVRNASGFRPSIREGRSLVGRLWNVTVTHAHERLSLPSQALASALGISEATLPAFHESIISVLARPSTRDSDPSARFCRNLLVSVATACQLITVAEHSDSYSSYAIELLYSI